jgi:C-terminal processing protease CtpA/Prc
MRLRLAGLSISLVLIFLSQAAPAQKMDSIERDRLKLMLNNIKSTIKKEYYDPNYHGIDLDARFKAATERLNQVTTTGQGMGVIAQALLDFNDSHLFFLPPATNLDVEYGWRYQIYGDRCFVTRVNPKSDAAAKGLKVGDQVLAIEQFRPTRGDLWKMNYYYNVISKRPGLNVRVLSPGASEPRDLAIESKIIKLPKVINIQMLGDLFDKRGRNEFDYNYFKYVGGATIWKMPSFSILPTSIDTMMAKIKGSNLILDLRGNGGGYVDTLERLAGFMFDKDLTIAELKGRKEMKPQQSKTRGKEVFSGKLIVLVDAESGSAAEIFARLVQIEKRGTVLGDVSSGSVMQSRSFVLTAGANDEVTYGVSVTNADVIMSDGKSIEHVGVTPDEIVNPTGADLAKESDPVLARALALAGAEISPEEAGKYFQYVWKEYQGRDIIEITMR